MKYIFTIWMAILPITSFCQSIKLADLKTLITQSNSDCETYLFRKGFVFSRERGNSVKVYDKADETVYIGWTWATKDGRQLKEVSYMTNNKTYFVLMIGELKESFTYKDSDKKDNSTIIYLENDKYKVQISMNTGEGEYSLVNLREK